VGGFQSRYAQTCKSRLEAASRPATEGNRGDMFTIYPTNPDSQGCKPFWSPGEFDRRALASGLQAPCLSGLSPLAACHLLAAPPYVHGACPRPAASPEQLDNQTGPGEARAKHHQRQCGDVGHPDEIGAGELIERFGPGAANGKVTVRAVRRPEAPMLRAASSSSASTAANAAAAIQTAITRPCTACTSTTPAIVPLSPTV
jgi:hypothetical protein